MIRAVPAALLSAWAFAAPATAQIGMPPGFHTTTVAGLMQPTAFAAAPDGRVFIAEKQGRVKVINPGSSLPPALVYDLKAHVNSHGDRGLLGIAVDQSFAANGYVYLYYVYEHNPGDGGGKKVARLTRITVKANSTVANPTAAETVLIGSYTPPPTSKAACPAIDNHVDCIPAETGSHNGGAIRTGVDGTIWLTIGDANLGYAEPNRFRPYDEHSFAGKIVHVDRNGRGLPGHPFCPSDVDLTAVCTKLWAKGFRNPFRMSLRPTKPPIVGDVGQNQWEELDVAEGGRNYGWPCYEGSRHFATLEPTSRCAQEYALEGSGAASAPPIYEYEHTPIGAAIIAGPQYAGSQFPGRYRGDIFVGDYTKTTLDRVIVDDSDHVVGVEPFAKEWAGVDLQEMPNGALGYILLTGTFGTIEYTLGNAPPTAAAHADRDHGALPLDVNFDAAGSFDPDNDPLEYEWSFGDGTPNVTGAQVTHSFTTSGRFTVTVTVRDGRGAQSTASVTVWAGDEAPAPVIESPADGGLYQDGVPLTLRGSGSDPEDGALGASALRWSIVLHHGTHTHPFDEATGPQTTLTPLVDHDADSYYRISLTATDSLGLSATRTIVIRPQTIRLTMASDPPGARLSYSGTDFTAPSAFDAAVGFRASVSTPTTFSAGGVTYVFDHWSDGGGQVHTFSVPATDAAVTAVYRADPDPPNTTITKKPTQQTALKANTFEFTSSEANSSFECRIDAGSWFGCGSPYKTPALAKGWHDFAVRAIDRAGNVDPTPATWRYHIV